MKSPSLYINVSQTIFAVILAGMAGSYIFKKDFREDTNKLFKDLVNKR